MDLDFFAIWSPTVNLIDLFGEFIHLSPTEGRINDLQQFKSFISLTITPFILKIENSTMIKEQIFEYLKDNYNIFLLPHQNQLILSNSNQLVSTLIVIKTLLANKIYKVRIAAYGMKSTHIPSILYTITNNLPSHDNIFDFAFNIKMDYGGGGGGDDDDETTKLHLFKIPKSHGITFPILYGIGGGFGGILIKYLPPNPSVYNNNIAIKLYQSGLIHIIKAVNKMGYEAEPRTNKAIHLRYCMFRKLIDILKRNQKFLHKLCLETRIRNINMEEGIKVANKILGGGNVYKLFQLNNLNIQECTRHIDLADYFYNIYHILKLAEAYKFGKVKSQKPPREEHLHLLIKIYSSLGIFSNYWKKWKCPYINISFTGNITCDNNLHNEIESLSITDNNTTQPNKPLPIIQICKENPNDCKSDHLIFFNSQDFSITERVIEKKNQ
ncbi:unnamed protein product [Dimorphilus gyrociliatus]|uniref:Uncharacterized protein n=1 Tax=Dimorphilus gyrociliatus TaxID=2664684 RepID=A0A7I8WEH1_9ANNE|nr:unnamed protein product [Dimorphilus gyrociliatus]